MKGKTAPKGDQVPPAVTQGDAARRVYPYDPEHCPLTATWNVIGAKWKGVIWWRLSDGVGRFTELQRAIPQISKKVLIQQLREMEGDGLVHRKIFPEVPPRVEYSLTAYGRSLAPAVDAMAEWGAKHLARKNDGHP